MGRTGIVPTSGTRGRSYILSSGQIGYSNDSCRTEDSSPSVIGVPSTRNQVPRTVACQKCATEHSCLMSPFLTIYGWAWLGIMYSLFTGNYSAEHQYAEWVAPVILSLMVFLGSSLLIAAEGIARSSSVLLEPYFISQVGVLGAEVSVILHMSFHYYTMMTLERSVDFIHLASFALLSAVAVGGTCYGLLLTRRIKATMRLEGEMNNVRTGGIKIFSNPLFSSSPRVGRQKREVPRACASRQVQLELDETIFVTPPSVIALFEDTSDNVHRPGNSVYATPDENTPIFDAYAKKLLK